MRFHKAVRTSVFLLVCAPAIGFAASTTTVINRWTGHRDYIADIGTTSIKAGTNITVTDTDDGVEISATSGGGGGYAVEPATVTFQLEKGHKSSTGTYTTLSPGVMYIVAASSNIETAASGVINTSTNPVDWTLLKNVPAGFADGIDNTGGGGGTTITVQDGGTTIIETSTMDFTGAQFIVTDNGGEALVALDPSSVTLLGMTHASRHQNSGADEINVAGLDGLLSDPQEVRVSTDGTQVSVSTGINFISGTGINVSGVETGNRADITIASTLGTQVDISAETNLTVEAPVLLVGDEIRVDKSSVTLLGPGVTLGTETDGVYVASLTATSPIALSGTNNVEGGAPIIALTQNAGTDVTADLEEETHATEHQDGGADEISVTGLSGLLADPQEIRFSTNGTSVSVSTGANFIPGTQITLAGVETGNRFDLTITNGFGSTVDDTELTGEDFGDFTCTGSEDGCTADADSIALGTDTTGVYVASITANASLSVSGTNNVESAAPIMGVDFSSAISRSDAATLYQPLDATLTDLAAAPLGEDNSISVGAIAAGTLPTDVIASSINANAVTLGQMADDSVSSDELADDDWGDVSISAGVATVDNVAAANVAAGSLGSSVLASSFPATGVTAGTYGSATQVSSITVNAQGAVTRATNLSISISTTNLNATGATSTNFLRGDNTWATPAGSGDAVLVATQTWSGGNTYRSSSTFLGPVLDRASSAGSSGQVLASSGPGLGVYWTTVSAGGSDVSVDSFTHTYTPLQVVLGSGTFVIENSTTNRPMGLFDASSHEWADWQSIDLRPYNGGTLTADIAFTMASATSGGVTWCVQCEAITSNDAVDFDTASFDVCNSTSGATFPSTAGQMRVVSVTLTNADSAAAGDSFRVRLNRLPADSGDTATGDAEFRWMAIRE